MQSTNLETQSWLQANAHIKMNRQDFYTVAFPDGDMLVLCHKVDSSEDFEGEGGITKTISSQHWKPILRGDLPTV